MNVNGGMSYSQIRQQFGDSFAKYLDEMDGVADGKVQEEALNRMLDEFATVAADNQGASSFEGVGGAGGYQIPMGVPPAPIVGAPGMGMGAGMGMAGMGMMNPMMMGMYGWTGDPGQGQQLATMQALGSHMMSSGVGGGMMFGGGMAGIGMMGGAMMPGMMGMMGGMPATAHAFPVVAGGNAQFHSDMMLEGSLKGLDGKVGYLQNVMAQAAQVGDMKTMQEAGIQLQKYMQMQQVLTQMLTNVMKMQHDISKSIIGNIR